MSTPESRNGGVEIGSGISRVPGGAKTLWALVGLVLLGLLLWAIRPDKAAPTGGREGLGGPMPVGVATVANGAIAITLNALGTVTPLATATVRPQVSGQIIKINFREGQAVNAGDLLAQIDPRPFQAALDQAKGQLERDQATLVNAQRDLVRQQGLFALKATSDQLLATQAALVRETQAVVKSDAANVEAAAINLSYSRIVAPVAGRVGLRQVDLGNLVQAGQTNGIAVVTQLQPISVLFALPEDNIDAVMSQVRGGAQLTADAYDRGQTQKIASGTLATIDNQIDITTGTVKLRAMFDNTKGELFPNQFVNIRLRVKTLIGQAYVPASAIERGAQGAFVYVVQADNTVAMRGVTIGPQDGDRVGILKGLKAGEVVVTDGADRLRDGAEVTLPGRQKPGATPIVPTPAAGSDARASRRAALDKACGDDFRKFCPTAQGFERFQCLRENTPNLSASCRTAASQMRKRRQRSDARP